MVVQAVLLGWRSTWISREFPAIELIEEPLMPGTVAPTDRTSAWKRETVSWLWRWFWRVTLVVSLGYAWYCFYVPSNHIAWAKDYTAAQQQSAESGKPMILYFSGKWCVPCRIMKRQVWADQQVAALVNDRFIPVAIDVDHPNSAAVAARYNVVGPPVTMITDPQSNTLDWREGGMDKTEFLQWLRAHSADR